MNSGELVRAVYDQNVYGMIKMKDRWVENFVWESTRTYVKRNSIMMMITYVDHERSWKLNQTGRMAFVIEPCAVGWTYFNLIEKV